MRHWGKKGFDDLSLDVHKYLRVSERWQGRGRTSNSCYSKTTPRQQQRKYIVGKNGDGNSVVVALYFAPLKQ